MATRAQLGMGRQVVDEGADPGQLVGVVEGAEVRSFDIGPGHRLALCLFDEGGSQVVVHVRSSEHHIAAVQSWPALK